MATISAYDSSSINVLFSSLSTSSSSSSSGTTDLLGISYTDYASIRNGSYYKLMKAYYDTSSTSSSTSTSADSSTTLAGIETASDDLKDALSALQDDSLYEKVTTTDEDGNTTTDYDRDAIYKALSEFVDSYNAMLTMTAKSDTTNILRTGVNMIGNTAANSSLLASIGITIGTDSKLTIDEDTFKSADIATVKSLFQGTGSYGYQTSTSASLLATYAQVEASKAATYSSSGSYTYNYSTGEIYSSSV